MSELAGIDMQLAEEARDEAAGGDRGDIFDGEQAVMEGNALRASEDFKDAVNKYKDALAKFESAIP